MYTYIFLDLLPWSKISAESTGYFQSNQKKYVCFEGIPVEYGYCVCYL